MSNKYTNQEKEQLFSLKVELQIAWEDKDTNKYNEIVNQIRFIKNH